MKGSEARQRRTALATDPDYERMWLATPPDVRVAIEIAFHSDLRPLPCPKRLEGVVILEPDTEEDA